jgi:hypothetical protein
MTVKRAPLIGLAFLILVDLIYWLTSGIDTYNSIAFYLVWWPVAWLIPIVNSARRDDLMPAAGIALFVLGQAIDLIIYTFIANYFLKRRMRGTPSNI